MKKDKKSGGKAAKKGGQSTAPDQKEVKRLILSVLSAQNGKSFNSKEILAATGLWHHFTVDSLRGVLDMLSREGKLTYVDKGRYQYQKEKEKIQLEGRLEVTRGGSGYLLMPDGKDIYIAPTNLGMAFHGDTVKVRIHGRHKKEGRTEGEVVEVLERARKEYVGTIEQGPGVFFFLPDDTRMHTDFFIPRDKLNGAKPGDKVVIQLVSWEKRSPEAEVMRVLGKSGEHNTEMHAILLQYGFQTSFPPQVERESEAIPVDITEADYEGRRDFRKITTFTIDPIDAKDFDDALSFRILENGNYEVGVHIADVSHYVKPGSLLDQEAFKRATSVYLVDRTVPMLPEKLSNILCSLRPKETKLTFSAVFEMDAEGQVLNKWIGKTVIFSDYRFHYEEAQDVIDGRQDGPFREELITLNKLAKKLREKRVVRGSIEFSTDEVKFELDEQDRPVRVIRKKFFDTNRLIEDFMLLANRTVAAWVKESSGRDNPPPFVYRVHDNPDPEKMTSLQNFIGAFGYRYNLERAHDLALRLNQLLGEVEGKPEQNVVESIAIRAMAKAVYSTKNIGHFGLGFSDYTHFTSPIRRYPDLMVHRLLEKYLANQFTANPAELETQCQHSSVMEKTAAEAERASIKYKQVEFLSERIGKTFTGIISGVIDPGFFVELDENLCEGFVAARTLEDDYYQLDQETYSLRGVNHGRRFRLGDRVAVRIMSTDLKRRSVDMEYVGEPEVVAKLQK